MDSQFCEPTNVAFDFYLRTYRRALARAGGDAATARKLYRYFLEAQIPNPNLGVVQRVDVAGEAKALALSTLQATADAILREGLASKTELEVALAGLAAVTADPTTIIGGPRTFQLWSRKE